jgi:hypothetical protein
MGEVINFRRRTIDHEGLLDAIERFVDDIDLPMELYDQFSMGLLRTLYGLKPPDEYRRELNAIKLQRRKRKKKRK